MPDHILGSGTEQIAMFCALATYITVAVMSFAPERISHKLEPAIMIGATGALLIHGIAIGIRWSRLDHGPFINMYEILSSNIWSLSCIYFLFYWRFRALRPTASVATPVILVLVAWLLTARSVEAPLPPTYDTIWLYFHVLFGKLFLGMVLIAVSLCGVVLLRTANWGRKRFITMPNDTSLDNLAFRFVALGFICESMMLVVGAIWAQDAWGRYWAWDPLETWAFLTWLCVALILHIRLTRNITPVISAALVMFAFALAFLTFFGIPFISLAPHKGMI